MEKVKKVAEQLKILSNPKNLEGITQFGISPDKTLGVSISRVKKRGCPKKTIYYQRCKAMNTHNCGKIYAPSI